VETVDGNLQAAIDQYKKIVAENSGNRVVAARALLRLAGCYEEKLARLRLKKTYRQLINDYADQTAEVTLAKQKLAALCRDRSEATVHEDSSSDRIADNARFALSPTVSNSPTSHRRCLARSSPRCDGPTIAGAPRQIFTANQVLVRNNDIAWSGDGNWLALHVRERDADKNEYASTCYAPPVASQGRFS